jgi:hypothetical protein
LILWKLQGHLAFNNSLKNTRRWTIIDALKNTSWEVLLNIWKLQVEKFYWRFEKYKLRSFIESNRFYQILLRLGQEEEGGEPSDQEDEETKFVIWRKKNRKKNQPFCFPNLNFRVSKKLFFVKKKKLRFVLLRRPSLSVRFSSIRFLYRYRYRYRFRFI